MRICESVFGVQVEMYRVLRAEHHAEKSLYRLGGFYFSWKDRTKI